MSSKTILHIFPSLELGGSQRRFIDLVAHTPENIYHQVIALDSNYVALDGLKSDAPIKIIGGPKLNGGLWANIRTIRKFLKSNTPDLLITYNWGAVEWALANRLFPLCPVLQIQDGFGADEQDQELSRRKQTRSMAYKGATELLVPSQTLKEIAQNSWGVRPAKLHYIPNGVNTSVFTGDADIELVSKLGIKEGNMVIGTVAALRPEKNIGNLIEAFGRLPESPHLKLVIVGDGIGMSALKMLTERIGLTRRVIFTGNMDEPERIVPRFDIFALSSETEQMPLSVIEAMAAAKPIASTDVGDVRHMVSKDNQPFIIGNTPARLAESIKTLIMNPQAQEALGEANKLKALSEFNADTMRENHYALYKGLMES